VWQDVLPIHYSIRPQNNFHRKTMATSKDLQLEITRLEADLLPIHDELDAIYRRFGGALVPDVANWMTSHVQTKIEANAAKINEAGVEPLRLIKADLHQLIAQLPEICTAAIGTPEQWPHRSSATSEFDSSTSSKKYHEECFRRAVNPLGFLLAKHGIRQPQKGYADEWKSNGGNEYRYAFGLPLDVRNHPILQEYETKRKQGVGLQRTITAKKIEVTKAQARELWDDA
jgi:hypothetical protein